MTKRWLSFLAFIPMTAGIFPAFVIATTFSGEMSLPHASDYSGDAGALSSWTTGPPELENPVPNPAGKALADDCPPVDVSPLAGDDLVDFVRNTSVDCLGRTESETLLRPSHHDRGSCRLAACSRCASGRA